MMLRINAEFLKCKTPRGESREASASQGEGWRPSPVSIREDNPAPLGERSIPMWQAALRAEWDC